MVADKELLIGRMRLSSRLPQYLMTAMFTGAVQVTVSESGGMDIVDVASGNAMSVMMNGMLIVQYAAEVGL